MMRQWKGETGGRLGEKKYHMHRLTEKVFQFSFYDEWKKRIQMKMTTNVGEGFFRITEFQGILS